MAGVCPLPLSCQPHLLLTHHLFLLVLYLCCQARGRVPGRTGVWVGERKLGAIGVRVTGGVTSHGVALNVGPDLTWYRHIIPCGNPDKEVTSLAAELGRARSTGMQQQAMAAGGIVDAGGSIAGAGQGLTSSQAAAGGGSMGEPCGLDMSTAEGVLVESLARHLGHPSWCGVTPQQLMDAVGWSQAGGEQQAAGR